MGILFGAEVYASALRVFANFLLVSVAISLLMWILLLVTLRDNEEKSSAVLAAMILTVTLLGCMTGYAGGNSRTSVVGDVIPAVLTFFGGLVVYLFGVKSKMSPLTPFLVSAFVVSLFIGYGMGAKKRQLFEIREARKEVCIEVFSDPQVIGNELALQTAATLFGRRCKSVIDIAGHLELGHLRSSD